MSAGNPSAATLILGLGLASSAENAERAARTAQIMTMNVFMWSGVAADDPENAESFCPFPDLCPGVANTSLGEGIAFDLDRELEGLTNQVRGALVGVFDGFEILNTFQRVGAAVAGSEQLIFSLRTPGGVRETSAADVFCLLTARA